MNTRKMESYFWLRSWQWPIPFPFSNPATRWVKLSGMIPRDQIEEKYSLTFDNPIKGNPAKSCRMAIGSLIIKEMFRFSDEDTVAMITENPYLQFFIGFLPLPIKNPLMRPQ